LAHADSAHDSMNLICETIEKLSFPQSKSKSKSKFSVHKLMHLKNQIRFMMKGDNYTRIKQKFTEKDVAYAHKKMSLYISNYTINDKVFEINC
ncbi:hypothetical protein, partial [Acinetobacter baumannii]|uniref:hypothetical protein n=1 Tax=Acinetobacter baumannii TaxID=470 RepID=UPI0037D93D6B